MPDKRRRPKKPPPAPGGKPHYMTGKILTASLAHAERYRLRRADGCGGGRRIVRKPIQGHERDREEV